MPNCPTRASKFPKNVEFFYEDDGKKTQDDDEYNDEDDDLIVVLLIGKGFHASLESFQIFL